jgi:hypothetical protein
MCQKEVSGPSCRLADPECPQNQKALPMAALVAAGPYMSALPMGVKSGARPPFVHPISTALITQPILFDV